MNRSALSLAAEGLPFNLFMLDSARTEEICEKQYSLERNTFNKVDSQTAFMFHNWRAFTQVGV